MKNKSYGIGSKGKKEKMVNYYFSRLEYWKMKLKQDGYTQEIFKKAQKDVKNEEY